jgi:hypothetical protein
MAEQRRTPVWAAAPGARLALVRQLAADLADLADQAERRNRAALKAPKKPRHIGVNPAIAVLWARLAGEALSLLGED